MQDSNDARVMVPRPVGSRGSEPARLCCALTHLSQALSTCVPSNEMRIALARGVCECRGFHTEEIGWRSEDGAS
jgi:hypothetical protein